jgi:hypothetical protein
LPIVDLLLAQLRGKLGAFRAKRERDRDHCSRQLSIRVLDQTNLNNPVVARRRSG